MPWRTWTTCAVSGPSSRSSACRAIPGARCVRRAPGGRAARMNDLRRWTIVVVFAVAMAWMESAGGGYLGTPGGPAGHSVRGRLARRRDRALPLRLLADRVWRVGPPLLRVPRRHRRLAQVAPGLGPPVS